MPDNKKRKRVVVAMSGGVDSSVAAAVCAKQGYDVIGVTLQLYKNDVVGKKKGSCCAGQDIYDAKKVANKIGIKHYVLDYEEQFKSEVIDDFTNSYANGLTPIPCVRCNEKIKFRDLYQTAKQLDASTLITGHYVSNKFMNGERALFRARDASKDQSYFMFTLKREQLDFIRFPLGDLTKEQTREIARELDLSIAEKPDSQDICFVPNGRYGDVVRRLRPGAVDAGDIRHLDGTVLGRHNGVIDYTIGQRRGLGIGGRAGVDESEGPLYVVGIDAETNTVLVGPQAALACHEVHLHDVNWINGQPENGARVLARLRNTAPAVNARIYCDRPDVAAAVIVLDAPQYGIASGQAAVLYQGDAADILLGGGWISKAPLATGMTHE